MGLAPSKDPSKNQKLRSSLEKIVILDVQVRKVEVISGVNGVDMDRHGLILWENEATGPRKVSKYLLGLRDAIFSSKMAPETKNPKIPSFPVYLISPPRFNIPVLICPYSRYTASAADMLAQSHHLQSFLISGPL